MGGDICRVSLHPVRPVWALDLQTGSFRRSRIMMDDCIRQRNEYPKTRHIRSESLQDLRGA